MERGSRFLLLAASCLLLLTILGERVHGQTGPVSDAANPAAGSDDVSSSNDTVTDDDTPVNDTSVDNTTSSNDTSVDNTTSSNDTSVDNTTSSIDTSVDGSTPEVAPQAPEKADFVVFDNNGNPCLLASLNITIHIKYHVQERLVRETYEMVSKKNTQDGSSHRGSCEDNLSSLSITWNNDTFTLNLTFSLQNPNEAKPNEIDMDVLPPGANSSSPSWSLQRLALSYDTANEQMFPGASSPSVEKVETEKDLNFFRTPLGMSYVCKTAKSVDMEFKDVNLTFNYVRLMPFGAESRYFSNETVECSRDMGPESGESYTVPLIVAAVLASIVIAILVIYATVRCVARRVRQADYKQME